MFSGDVDDTEKDAGRASGGDTAASEMPRALDGQQQSGPSSEAEENGTSRSEAQGQRAEPAIPAGGGPPCAGAGAEYILEKTMAAIFRI